MLPHPRGSPAHTLGPASDDPDPLPADLSRCITHQAGACYPDKGCKETHTLRRLYFVIPDELHALQVVTDLEAAGVDRGHIHALPGKGATFTQLPLATERQQHDTVWHLERLLWSANLALFALAVVGLLASIYFNSVTGGVAALAAMIASFAGGAVFALLVPDTHLDEFRGVLAHGEILLMVDVPKQKVFDVEEIMHRRHPEVVLGGAGWAIGRFGI